MSFLISSEWLDEHRRDEHVRVVDCRFELKDAAAGHEAYVKDHIPGAVFIDVEKHLSAQAGTHGGRHPLPDMDFFAQVLSERGIDMQTTVVAYDDQGGMGAARFWWLMQYAGHTNTYVLDRSYSHWVEEEFPITDEIPTPLMKQMIIDREPNQLVHLEEIKQQLRNEHVALVDARSYERYAGENEEVDAVSGHIPGAYHYFWKDVLREDGTWKSQSELRDHFQELEGFDEVISYCGSGITACVNVLGMREAGIEQVRLYNGSWSDWISYPDLPIEKEPNRL